MSSDKTDTSAWAAPALARTAAVFPLVAARIPDSRPSAGLPLTERELDVLKLIAEGYSTKQIAVRLGISFKTAACHRMHVMQKLGIHETASLVRWAVREKIVKA